MSSRMRVLTAVVFLALAARVVAAVALGGGFHFSDEAAYVDAAGRLLGGEGFGATYTRVPGYPVLLALLAMPGPGGVLWLRLAQAALTAIGAAVTFVAAERPLGRPAATAAAGIYALDPLLVVAGGLLYPEAIAAVLMTAVVLLAWEAGRRSSSSLAGLTGSLLGTLALFRPVALVTVPVVAAWILCFAADARRSRRALLAGLVGLTCLLVLAPWSCRTYRVSGRFIPVSLAGTRGASVSPEEMAEHGVLGSLADKAKTDPARLASRMAREFGHFWELVPSRLVTDDPGRRAALHRADPRLPARSAFAPTLRDAVSAATFGIELLLALAGMVLLWRHLRREAMLPAAIVLAYALGHSLFVGKLRYRITILPLVFLFAGAAASALHAAARRRFAGVTK